MGVLEGLIADLNRAAGPAVDELLARAHGALSGALLALGDFSGARLFARAALDGCRKTGDADGIRIYSENLDLLTALTADEPLTTRRARIVEAQQLSDAARYAASNEVLMEVASDVDSEHYVAKLCGLVGLNFYRLDLYEHARAWTEMALRTCENDDDRYGVTIYSENLEAIDRARAGAA